MYNKFGRPLLTAYDGSNPWWALLEEAVNNAGGKLGKPEIFPASTDARYFRHHEFPAIGFSPMTNTPVLLHDHNEVSFASYIMAGVRIHNEQACFNLCKVVLLLLKLWHYEVLHDQIMLMLLFLKPK